MVLDLARRCSWTYFATTAYDWCRPDGALLASLLDGSVVALDSETGQTLWTFDSGLPLLSSAGFSERPEGGKRAIFPSTDGTLYSYQLGITGEQGLEVCHTILHLRWTCWQAGACQRLRDWWLG